MADSESRSLDLAEREAPRAARAPPELSVLVPCYNEQGAILETLEGLRRSAAALGRPWELIVIDDGSTDDSPRLLDEAARDDASTIVVRHGRNLGYGAALKTGLRRARAPVVLIVDADGTYPSEEIPRLVETARDADMVVGARTGESVEQPWLRSFAKSLLRRYAAWLTGQSIPDLNSGLRIMRRDVVERFLNILPDGFSFTTTLTVAALANRFDVRFLPIDYKKRVGRSKIRPLRDTLGFCQLILRTGVYFAPLRVFAPLIALLSLGFMASLAYDVFVLGNLTDKTLILLMFAMNTALFALLADVIDKRSGG